MRIYMRVNTFSELATENMVQYFSKYSEGMLATSTVEQLKGWVIKGVEMFKVGTWRGQPYTEDDLDNMVKNFNTLKTSGLFEPIFKKDHSEKVEDQIGWIVNVYRDGELLKGDVHLTDWMAHEKLREGTWKYLSSEIYPPDLAQEEFGDSVSGHVLRGVAIVSIPKVKGLKGIVLNSEIIDSKGDEVVNREQIEALMKKLGMYTEEEIKGFSDEEIFAKFSEKLEERNANPAAPGEPGAGSANPGAGAPQLEGSAAGFKAFGEGQVVMIKAEDFTAMVEAVAGSEKKVVDLFSEVESLRKESREKKIERRISALMQAGKVTPAEKDGIQAFAEKLQDEETLATYFSTFEKRTPVVQLGELPGGQQGGEEDDGEKAFAAFKESRKQEIYE